MHPVVQLAEVAPARWPEAADADPAGSQPGQMVPVEFRRPVPVEQEVDLDAGPGPLDKGIGEPLGGGRVLPPDDSVPAVSQTPQPPVRTARGAREPSG